MFDCCITTVILTIVWFFSLLLIFTASNTGHCSGRITLVIATVISAFLRLVPEESIRDYLSRFYSDVFLEHPATVISTLIGLFIAYVYLFNYICMYDPDPPVSEPKVEGPGDTD